MEVRAANTVLIHTELARRTGQINKTDTSMKVRAANTILIHTELAPPSKVLDAVAR